MPTSAASAFPDPLFTAPVILYWACALPWSHYALCGLYMTCFNYLECVDPFHLSNSYSSFQSPGRYSVFCGSFSGGLQPTSPPIEWTVHFSVIILATLPPLSLIHWKARVSCYCPSDTHSLTWKKQAVKNWCIDCWINAFHLVSASNIIYILVDTLKMRKEDCWINLFPWFFFQYILSEHLLYALDCIDNNRNFYLKNCYLLTQIVIFPLPVSKETKP